MFHLLLQLFAQVRKSFCRLACHPRHCLCHSGVMPHVQPVGHPAQGNCRVLAQPPGWKAVKTESRQGQISIFLQLHPCVYSKSSCGLHPGARRRPDAQPGTEVKCAHIGFGTAWPRSNRPVVFALHNLTRNPARQFVDALGQFSPRQTQVKSHTDFSHEGKAYP